MSEYTLHWRSLDGTLCRCEGISDQSIDTMLAALQDVGFTAWAEVEGLKMPHVRKDTVERRYG